MAVQGGCDVRVKECEPCGRQSWETEMRGQKREIFKDREMSRKRARGRK